MGHPLKLWFCILGILIFLKGHAQESDTSATSPPIISLIGYLDLFYGFDFNQPETDTRLPFLYHYNRHNEVNMNHGYIEVSVSHDRYRANLGIQTGTYVIDNYSAEPDLLKLIYDANIGSL